jgi:hypothetical protein
METCETCRFWGRDRFGRALGGYNCDGRVSDCRRRAPIEIDRARYPGASRLWPETKIDDWCGEYDPTLRSPHD